MEYQCTLTRGRRKEHWQGEIRLIHYSDTCYEAEINMIIHSYGGEVVLEISEEGVYLSFNDCGPGISDVEKAMMPGYSTASGKALEFGFGAGMGLPNIKRVADTFDLQTSSQGTCLRIGFRI